jgi:hypothetical protein
MLLVKKMANKCYSDSCTCHSQKDHINLDFVHIWFWSYIVEPSIGVTTRGWPGPGTHASVTISTMLPLTRTCAETEGDGTSETDAGRWAAMPQLTCCWHNHAHHQCSYWPGFRCRCWCCAIHILISYSLRFRGCRFGGGSTCRPRWKAATATQVVQQSPPVVGRPARHSTTRRQGSIHQQFLTGTGKRTQLAEEQESIENDGGLNTTSQLNTLNHFVVDGKTVCSRQAMQHQYSSDKQAAQPTSINDSCRSGPECEWWMRWGETFSYTPVVFIIYLSCTSSSNYICLRFHSPFLNFIYCLVICFKS